MRRITKAIGALLGAATGAGIVAIFAAFGVTITLEFGVAIVGVLPAVGT